MLACPAGAVRRGHEVIVVKSLAAPYEAGRLSDLHMAARDPAGGSSCSALRFARVLRHRDDKPAAEADTVETVRAIHARADAP